MTGGSSCPESLSDILFFQVDWRFYVIFNLTGDNNLQKKAKKNPFDFSETHFKALNHATTPTMPS